MKKKALLFMIVSCLSLCTLACSKDFGKDTEQTTTTQKSKPPTSKETKKAESSSQAHTPQTQAPIPQLTGEKVITQPQTAPSETQVTEMQPPSETVPETEYFQTEASSEAAAPSEQNAQCRYCGEWFSTIPDANGISPYGSHVSQEEYYYDITANPNDGTAQCPYCGGWFSLTPQGDSWSEFDNHVLEEQEAQTY